jgi:hypothetical protein
LIRAAKKAGVEVGRAEIVTKDGTKITVSVSGQAEPEKPDEKQGETNPWHTH